MQQLKENFANKLTKIASQQFETGFNHKKGRLEQIAKNVEFYNLRKLVVPKGRFAVPLPIMGGFVDALVSKIDEPPSSKFKHKDLADLQKMRLVSMAFEKDSAPIRGNYPQIDRWAKKLAVFSGRAIYKYYAESNPKYRAVFGLVDYEDFITEPLGGGDLDKHIFKGQDSIFRTGNQLKAGAKSGLYDKEQVKKLLKSISSGEQKKNVEFYEGKRKRFSQLGLDIVNNTYVGQDIYKFIEWVMRYQGREYYLVFNHKTGVWLRAHLLTDVFKSGLSPWASWATNEDPSVFWSKAPCDDLRPICDTCELLLNQELYNRRKINMGQRLFDPSIIKDPTQLPWRPEGLVEGTVPSGKKLSDGIYEFKTGNLTTTIDLFSFLDYFGARKTGINPQAPGTPEDREERVGIRFADIQEMADRLGLHNKSYREVHDRMNLRYYWGAIEHLDEKTLTEMIGEEAIGWDKIKNEGSHNFDIELGGGAAEVKANEVKSRKRENALVLVSKDQGLRLRINNDWFLTRVLEQGEFEETEIKSAMSRQDTGDVEILGQAAKAIQDIQAGKEPKPCRRATTGFLQYLLDFATDKIEFDEKSRKKEDVKKQKIYMDIMRYFQQHIEVAMRNMAKKAMMARITRPKEETPQKPTLRPTEQITTEEPQPGSPGEGIKSGVAASNILRGKSPLPT